MAKANLCKSHSTRFYANFHRFGFEVWNVLPWKFRSRPRSLTFVTFVTFDEKYLTSYLMAIVMFAFPPFTCQNSYTHSNTDTVTLSFCEWIPMLAIMRLAIVVFDWFLSFWIVWTSISHKRSSITKHCRASNCLQKLQYLYFTHFNLLTKHLEITNWMKKLQ